MDNKIEKVNKDVTVNVDMKNVVDNYIFSNKLKLSEEEKALFYGLSTQLNLNPFLNEIHPIRYGQQFKVVTGYTVYIKKAEATGLLDGWEIVMTDSGAKCTIHRKDFNYPFVWEVEAKEFIKDNNPSWKSMPKFMIKKVCIAQAFRICFSEALSILPHIEEEVKNEKEVDITEYKVVEEKEVKQQTPAKKIPGVKLSKDGEKEMIELIGKADPELKEARLKTINNIDIAELENYKNKLRKEIDEINKSKEIEIFNYHADRIKKADVKKMLANEKVYKEQVYKLSISEDLKDQLLDMFEDKLSGDSNGE